MLFTKGNYNRVYIFPDKSSEAYVSAFRIIDEWFETRTIQLFWHARYHLSDFEIAIGEI